NWLCSKEQVVAIPKAASPDHMRENVTAVDFMIEKKDIEMIDRASSGFHLPSLGQILGRL
ncbi:MAG TPA: hypothetical protein VJ343_00095, partial [archaeon]|nr:hypothetical protein [archaeon]